MDLEVFEKMEKAELRSYLQFLLWHYRVVDAFWFLCVAERFDQFTAERLNEKVWHQVAGMAANAVAGSPRMGAIFGGMLVSGKKAAGLAADAVRRAVPS